MPLPFATHFAQRERARWGVCQRRGRKVLVFSGNFRDEGVLGGSASSGGGYGGMQAVIEVVSNYHHVFEVGGGRVIRGTA